MQITNGLSSTTSYDLNVHVPEVPPFNHSISFTIYTNVPIPSTTPLATTTIVPNDSSSDMIIIIVVVVLVVVVIGLVSGILGVMHRRRQTKQSSSSISSMQGILRLVS